MRTVFTSMLARLVLGTALLLVTAGILGATPPGQAHAASHGADTTSPITLPGLTGAERAWLQAHPVIRLGLNGVAPPWSYTVGDQYRGIHVDLIQRLSRDLGVRLDPVRDRPYRELLEGVDGGAVVDVIGLVPATPENEARMRFTDPVATVEYVLLVPDRASRLPEVTDLVGRRVAVVGDFSVRRWLERDYPGVVIVPTKSTIDSLRMASLGEVDAAVTTVGAASWLIHKEGLVNLRAQQVLYRTPLSLGVRRDWPELVTILNKAIAQVEPAEVDRITVEHVQLATRGFTRQQILGALAVIVVLVTAGVFLLQSRALMRERQLAAMLAQREREYRLLVENSLDGVLRTHPDGRILAANPAACAMFDLSEAELRESGRERVLDPRDPRLTKLLQDRQATGKARGVLTMRRADGTPFEAEVSSAMYQEADGQVFNSLLIRDVSERQRAEARLRLLQTCIEHLNDAVVVTEAEPFDEPGQRIVFVNEAFTRQTGYSEQEVIGRSTRFLQGPGTDLEELRRVGDALRRWDPVQTELLNYRKDGQPNWVEIKMVPIADETGSYTHWVAVERDITARKEAEAMREQRERQTRESQKMEAIGTLAGGIAHDFNNILGAISGQVAIASADLDRPGPETTAAKESLEQIKVAADRARRLVQRILAFSRREAPLVQAQALAPVIQETVGMLKATLPATVTLDVQLPVPALLVPIDATQMQQVLLNLCTNAWQALPDGRGRIDIRTEAKTFEGQGPEALPPGRYVHLSIRDEGKGMDAATRARIFEPFFTTKQPGQGTGLGLAVVHGIVITHGGAIGVDSALGQGTTFHVWLPAVEPAPDAPPPEAKVSFTAVATSGGHGERVLYIDDDEVMRNMVNRLLKRLGYQPTCMADPQEALAAFQAASAGEERFDVVVTDYNMPGLNGIELASAMHDLSPAVPVLLSSGYLQEGMVARAQAVGVREILQKENTVEELGPALQRLFGACTGSDPSPLTATS